LLAHLQAAPVSANSNTAGLQILMI